VDLNLPKLKALVHYVCRRVVDPSTLGRTKLHKILWLAEGRHFLSTGEPITGEIYKKMRFGPFAPHVEDVIAQLQRENRLYVRHVEVGDYGQDEFTAHGDPETSLFTERELSIVDRMIKQVTEDHTAGSISERTHDEIWEMAAMHEPLPFNALLAKRLLAPTEDDFEWARQEVAARK
jgi:hypothetical protein